MSNTELDSLLRSTNCVNAWTEWGTLRECCVGRAEGACYPPWEPGCRGEFRDETLRATIPYPRGPRLQSVIKKASVQLDNLVDAMEGEGIVVHRTLKTDFNKPIKTPDFENACGFTNTCPRDTIITFGNVIMEATMSQRSRYFEFLGTRHIVHHLFKNDKNMLWKAAPKPSMADSMYDTSFWDQPEERKAERQKSIFRYAVTEKEPVFDAACMMRMGADVVVLNSALTNLPGIEWMKRELKGHVNFRTMHPPQEKRPTHIDTTFMPIRPPTAGSRGIIMYCDKAPRNLWDSDLEQFRQGGFDMIPTPVPVGPELPLMCESSRWISTNVLQISPKKIIMEESATEMEEFLTDLGFDVIKVPFLDVLEFGGSLHCATWDINRDDERKAYLTGENGDVPEHSSQTNGH